MDALVLARWQFGITTVYHFLFVPLTIGLTWLVAIMQTKWTKTGNVAWYKLTKLFGKIFLINFAAGVVTGIVQEFQFGMNWSEYSRFVGDIFGAPLALEALIAFFLESTFVGLWIFGWKKLPKKVHLLMIYLTAIGTSISSIFILAANCFMQNPVGAKFDLENGRAGLVNMIDLITNPFFLVTFPHVIGGSFMLAGGMVAAVAGWWFAKGRHIGDAKPADPVAAEHNQTWLTATRFGAWVVLIGAIVTILSGHFQTQVEQKYQPLKFAASEAVTVTQDHAPFAVIAIFNADGTEVKWALDVPNVLSYLSDYRAGAVVPGLDTATVARVTPDGYLLPGGDSALNQIQQDLVNAGSLTITHIDPPNMWVTFYTFRIMLLLGFVGLAFAIILLAKVKPESKVKPTKGWTALMLSVVLLPIVGSAAGWLLTEIGRQPWIVNGVLPTASAVSPTVTALEVLASLVIFTLVYAIVAVIVVKLFLKSIRQGLPEDSEPSLEGAEDDAVLHFAY